MLGPNGAGKAILCIFTTTLLDDTGIIGAVFVVFLFRGTALFVRREHSRWGIG